MTQRASLMGAASLALLVTCSPATTGQPGKTKPKVQEEHVVIDTPEEQIPEGLDIRLSEGKPRQELGPTAPAAPATKLDEERTRALLSRLPPAAPTGDEAKPFAMREGSLPPPKTGETMQQAFPPPARPPVPEVESGPLEVLRVAPEGEVPIAPQVSVTFSQPMVPVTSHATLSSREVPVALTPEPQGTWRWVGTRTLLFEAGERLPMATAYSVEVPAGTRAANGNALAAAKRWRFATPAPLLQQSSPRPHGPRRVDTLMFIGLDQRIDPAAVLAKVKVLAAKKQHAVRLATAEEIRGDAHVRSLVEQSQEGRWLAFRTVEKLPAAAQVKVTLGPGTPSLEGPLETTKPQSFTFQTYEPLRVVRHRCGWSRESCPPHAPFTIELNNPLDTSLVSRDLVTVEPELPGLDVNASSSTLVIQGRTKARTTYRVTLSPELTDEFGQKLGEARTLSFAVGSAEPQLMAPRQGFVVLEPAAKGRYSVFSVNFKKLKVRVFKVQPQDWPAFADFMEAHSWRSDASLEGMPGTLVRSDTIAVAGEPDDLVETPIDLTPALADGFGNAIVFVEHVDKPPRHRDRTVIRSWVQVTRTGIAAFADGTSLLAWVTELDSGKPLEGVEVKLAESGETATTGADGLATLSLGVTRGRHSALVASRDGDVALLPESTSWWSSNIWARRERGEMLRWYVLDDRGMYKPGEKVHVKGWLRRVSIGEGGDVEALGDGARTVHFTLVDPRGKELQKGQRPLNALGGFDLTLDLPDDINLGRATLRLLTRDRELGEANHHHSFQVQEFRRPEFEISMAASDGPHFVRRRADLTVTAAYYAGGGLPDAEVHWQVTSRPGTFVPPNRDDFSFGPWQPWWMPWHEPARGETESFEGRTDALGKHHLEVQFRSVKPPRPTSVKAEARVIDVNRQAWAASTDLLVHPAALYVGLRTDRAFYERGKPFTVEAVVVDLDGKAVPGHAVEVQAAHLKWVNDKGVWKEKEEQPQPCVLTSGLAPVSCEFETADGGSYRVRAVVRDEEGRPNQTELSVWVTGGKLPPARDVEQEKVSLIPDRKEYQAGQTAQVLVQAPFSPAEGLLTLRRSGIVESRRFRMDGPSTTLEVPLTEAHLPNVYVQVDLVGSAPRVTDEGEVAAELPSRPAFASGQLSLKVPPLSRALGVAATPRDAELEPGGKTVVDLVVKDAAGKPVAGAEAVVVVVDEAILALSGYELKDPLKLFYFERDAGVSDHHLRASIVLARPDEMRPPEEAMEQRALPSGGLGRDFNATPAPMVRMKMARADEGGPAPAPTPIRVRADFNPLALFAPEVPTGADGRARVEVKLPDNLTRYRVMAVAVAGGKLFGMGESTITARLPLMVRPSPPRFLNFGDRFELPVVLQNQTGAPLTVELAVRPTNAELTDGAGRRVSVPARDRVEVRLPAAAAMPGKARFEIAAVAGSFADAASAELPVWTPATTEAFATYGEVDRGAVAQPIEAPGEVVPQFGGLTVTTSSTALQALTDAVLYLVAYPFACAEQVSSRLLAIAALKDVLAAFEAEGLPPPEELLAAVERDIQRLQGLQNPDGGFGLWRREGESWPYVSVHAAHALWRARQKGFDVPDSMLKAAREYLTEIERHVSGWPWEYERRIVTAYAVYVLHLMGDDQPDKARRLLDEKGLDGLALEAVGWLLPVLAADSGSASRVAAIRTYLGNRVTETAGAASFATSYRDADYLTMRTSRRADAVVLESLVETEPKSDLIPKLVRGLLSHRKQGRWGNTQENVFVLLALDAYFGRFEAQTPEFVARAWLGERFAGEHAFKGRTTEQHAIDIPMSYLAAGDGRQDLVLSKDGKGRMYYRVGMRYAPASLSFEPADHGFTVERVYEAVDDPGDVRRDEAGVWHVEAGARVRVRLRLVAPARRYHVALVDPLPAGLEPLNPALKVTGDIPRADAEEGRGGWWWWRRTWYEHQNMRDERVEAFASLLWDGVHSYTYIARATTPGVYVVPPARAEEMYSPETFGRCGTDRMIVE